jgi:Rod binding domain-containing protein
MSLPATTGSTGLPPVNQALEPAWVRHGSPATQKAYESALAFEQTLVEQLSQSLTSTSGLGGEGSQEGESGSEESGSSEAGAGNSQISSQLPQALTASVMHGGGLGLAAQLTGQLDAASGAANGAAQAQPSGGTAPPATGTGAAPASPTTSSGGGTAA